MRRLILVAVYLGLLLVSHLVRDRDGPGTEPMDGQRLTTIHETRGIKPTGRDIELAYWDLPAATGSLDAPVLVLHGSPVATPAMVPYMRALEGRARIIAPDLPGLGASTRVVADYSFKAHAEAVLQLLDQLGIERVHVAAYSMGGGVALELYRLAPERVESAVLISALGVQELELLGDYSLNHMVHGLQFAVIWALQELVPHFGLLDRFPLNTSYARNFLDSDQRPMRGILKSFEPPMLILHGREDFFVPPAAAREHARLVPQSILKWFAGGHLVVITDPGVVAGPTMEFLRGVESGAVGGRATASPARLAAAAEPFDFRRHGERGPAYELGGAVMLGLATLVSEDLACISGGLLAARGAIGFPAAVFGCFAGIVVGDVLLFLAGKFLGARALRRRPWRWVLNEDRVGRCASLFRRRGAMLVLTARFLPGLRLPTYFAAGAMGMRLGSFLLYFVGAALLWTPLLVGAAAVLGNRVLIWADYAGNWGWIVGLLGVAALWGGSRLILACSTHRGRRLLVGWWRRKTRWEYWPAWVLYPPVVLYMFWLGLRYRGFTVFTAANPGMPCGGLAGESKSKILQSFENGPEEIARFAVIEADSDVTVRLGALSAFMEREGLKFPVVLKPDVGERGQGVAVVRDRTSAADVLSRCRETVIAQEYVGGREFGLFYARRPSEERGRIISITAKHLTTVTGDGSRTLEELILDDDRAVCMARFFLNLHAERLSEVPAKGELVRLTELGTHCRGASFADGWDEAWSRQLEERLDAVSKTWDGFFFGRYDVRTPSADALREKADFRVLEVNGVTSESTHMYDSRFKVTDAWHILFTQWRLAFAIGSENRSRGHRPAGAREIYAAISTHLGRSKFEV